jgi:UDP-N-acetylglucosamine acyltransferase
MRNNIHKTAIVDESLVIGNNVAIGPYTVIHPNVKIGNNTIIESHCVLNSNTEIGNNNRIYDHVIIGSDPQDLSFDTSRKTFVQILDNNIIREYTSIHRSTKEEKPTKIFNKNMIMANSHIAHDCILGNNIIMTNLSVLGGHCIVEDNAVLGGNTMVHQHVRIGKLSMTAGGSRVTRDVIPYMLLGRNPVKHYCLNKVGIKRYGISSENYKILEKALKNLRKGEDINNIKPISEDLQYLISWFSVKSERGHHSFI